MVESSSLTQSHIVDPDTFEEFVSALADIVPQVERNMARLKRTPTNDALVNDLFRALHNIKGDAATCRVELGIAIAHPIETLLDRLRAGEMAFSDLLAEVVLLGLDRLELAVEAMAAGKQLHSLKLPELVSGLERMANAGEKDLDGLAVKLIESVTGFRPALADAVLRARSPAAGSPQAGAEDMAFFRNLAHQLEARSPLFHGRSGRLLRLALDTNTAAGQPVDPAQLEAAVLMHDIGMMFLPESVWLKVGHLSDDDRQQLRCHPEFAAGLLSRMAGWQGAAEIAAQHHEKPSGGGYPKGLSGDAICPGARLMAIVDAFEAVTLKHSHRGDSRSLLRAIAEINACDDQFAPEWIGHFNSVVRVLAR